MRPSHDETWLAVAAVIAERATCARRRVGCVLVNASYQVLSTGYNGPAAGEPHCIDTGGQTDRRCAGADLPSGTGLSVCEAIHAEANALLQCANVNAIQVAFVTTPPCLDCVKLLMNTGCRRIVCTGDYPQAAAAKELWTRPKLGRTFNREWVCVG
jgi:dCMP deaminase